MGSDGGGEAFSGGSPLQGELWWVPVVISVVALAVSLVVPLVNIRLERRAARRQAVRDALASLLTPEVVRSRVVLAKMARDDSDRFVFGSPLGSTEEEQLADSNEEFYALTDSVRSSSFTVMWAIQALVPTLKPYAERQFFVSIRWPVVSVRKGVAVPEAETVLDHVELMSSELARALDDWGFFVWYTPGKMTNEALVRLSEMLGRGERELVQLDLPETEEEAEARRRAEVRRELTESPKFGEERAAERARNAAATEEWQAVRARWKPKIKPPREPDSDARGEHRDS